MQTRSGTARLGDPADPPVLLIMGVGAQLPMWPDGFCDQLVKQGYRVIRFDHRDTGLSTKMRGKRANGSIYPRVGRYLLGRRSPVPYTLVDLAGDVKGLLDHLGIERAHVVGASMGGMIAQVLAGSHPDRLASLGLIMSSSGKPLSALPRWRVIKLAFDPPARDAAWEDRLAVEVRNISVINGPNFLPPVDALRRRVEELRARSACGASSTPSSVPAACCATPAASPRRRSSFTAPTTRWSGRATAATWPAQSPVHGSSSSMAWATTCPSRCGGRSSRRSPRTSR